MNGTIPKNGVLSGMIIPALTAVVVLGLGLLSPAFRGHFAAPLTPQLERAFFITIVAMVVHKLESLWLEEYEHCPVYLTLGQSSPSTRRAIFLAFVPTFLGMMGVTFLAYLGPPWHLLMLTVWLGQGAHELHHLAKSLARRRVYPGTASALLFVGTVWLGIFPRWFELVVGAGGPWPVAMLAALPGVVMAYYLEDRWWLSRAAALSFRRDRSLTPRLVKERP